jgi:teichoic acid transport system ATP-binding protein
MSRSSRRYVAPVALAAFAAAVALVVSNGTGGRSASKTSSTPTTARSHSPLHHTYLVRSGDNLSAISARTGVTVVQIEQLNPGLDPIVLHPGQRIRLRK